MAIQLSTAVRNARLDQIEVVAGATAKFEIRTGAQPGSCAAADSGTLLANITLPSNWMADASGGTKLIAGPWTGTGIADGVARHFRLKDNAGTTCHMQGSISETGGGGDAIIDNENVGNGAAVSVTTFTLTDANS